MSNVPRISVIIPYYNRPQFIEEAVGSVARVGGEHYGVWLARDRGVTQAWVF